MNADRDVWDKCLSNGQESINSPYHKILGDPSFFALRDFDISPLHDST